MPKYDAFGREIGEDTLAGLGGGSEPPAESAWQERTDREEAAWDEAERVEVARLETAADAADAQADQAEDARQEAAGDSRWTAPVRAEPTTPRADDEQRRRLAAQLSGALSQAAAARTGAPRVKRSAAGKGCLVAFVILILFVGAIIAGIASLVSSVDIDTPDSIISRPELQQPQNAPKGLEGESLVRPANLAAALKKIGGAGGGITNLRVAPERIDATLLTPAGRLRHVQVKPGGDLERFGPDSGPGFDSSETIPASKLDSRAPAKLARRGAEEVGVPVSELQYAVPQTIDNSVRWVVYFTRSRYVIGNAKGRFQAEYPRP